MSRWIGRVSDRMLGLMVPKVEAHAGTQSHVGCCDFCVCLYYISGMYTCRRCSCQMCG